MTWVLLLNEKFLDQEEIISYTHLIAQNKAAF